MSFWSLRPRRTVTPLVTVPALARQPRAAGSFATSETAETILAGGYYHFHLGDVFLPGAAGWALDPSHEDPLKPIWGNGVLRNPFAFAATAPQVVFTAAAAPFDAIRGVIYQGLSIERLGGVSNTPPPETFNG